VDEILDVTGQGRDEVVARVAAALRDGEIVVVPTDTVYGVAADAFNPAGTRRVFAAKRRPRSFPLPVLVRSPKQLPGICPEVPKTAENLMAAYWPGPLTIVLPAQPGLAWDLGDNDGTVAVRMPLDDVTLAIIREVGPLAVTSANLSGQPPATTVEEAREQLGSRVRHYVDDGPRTGGIGSTIVDLTRGAARVLRAGVVPDEDALAVAGGDLDPMEAAGRLDDAHQAPDPPGDSTRSSAAGSGDDERDGGDEQR
jgi:L-threonylcarbamoyladenylate synthase